MSKIVYEKVNVKLHERDGKNGPMTAEDAKEIVGWQVEEKEQDWGDDYLFRDLEGNKVRLTHCPTNRPFRTSLAKRYANEFVRKKWKLNGETIIVDRLGNVQNAQHRLVGLVLAEQMRKKDATYFREHFGWRTSVDAEMLIVTGINEKSDTIDTIDLGQKRSLGDVIYRRREFKSAKKRDQQRLANILAGATRLVWLRVGGRTVSDAPLFPHSEALDFLESHTRLNDAAAFIFNEEAGSEKRISTFISLGYAAGLLYLMGVAQTDPIKFMEKGVEAINAKGWNKAEEFWTLLASGADLKKGDPILLCRGALGRMSASGNEDRDEKCGIVVNAFNLWIEGKKGCEPADIKVKKGRDKDTGKMSIIETPRLGGLDVEREPDEEETAPDAEEEKAEGNGKPRKRRGKKEFDWTGEWAWVNSEDGAWKCKVKSVEGTKATVEADEDKQEYVVAVKDLLTDKPE